MEHKKIEFKGRQKLIVGQNDLTATHPDLCEEWDYEKNFPLIPENFSAGSEKKVFWLCSEGHSYPAMIFKRKNGQGCPYCSGKKILKGFNDLATTHPDLCEEWDYEKNFPLKPQEVSAGSGKKIFWLCDEGHSYSAMINNRANKKSGCPYCSGKKILKGFNDLATTHPDLCKEWDYEKNFPLTPQEVSAGSHKEVFWLCSEEHPYTMRIADRTNKKCGCPYCSGKKILIGFNDLATTHPDLCKEWDYEKNFPLTPQEVSAGITKKVFWLCDEGHSYSATINNRTNNKTGCPYCVGKKILKGFNDLATTHPNLCEEWDYEKNFPLTPQEVSAGSNKEVFWLCSEGHSYSAKIYTRTNMKCGCPYCSGRKTLTGFNDLATTHPNLCEEWDYEKNFPLTPQEVSAGSHKKFFWLCSERHSYFTAINNRTNNKTGCPHCATKKSEKFIGTLLSNLVISYKTQVNFQGCKDKSLLLFDYLIDDFRFEEFLIERQGEQHEFPVDFGGKGEEWAKEQFESNQRRDKIKVDFCQETGKILEFIWYYEDTEEALINLLRKYIKPEYNLNEILNTTREQAA